MGKRGPSRLPVKASCLAGVPKASGKLSASELFASELFASSGQVTEKNVEYSRAVPLKKTFFAKIG
jgi:hypothetical protein